MNGAEKIPVNAPKVVVIIGNGFDLDLGLKTSYSDFWKSKHKYLERYSIRLKDYGQYRHLSPFCIYINKVINEKWCDLEEALRTYCSTTVHRNESNIETVSRLASYDNDNLIVNFKYFNKLKSTLVRYLKTQQKRKRLNKDSCAANFLKQMSLSNEDVVLYNFNYTDINDFALKLGFSKNFHIEYIHGNLHDNNIILGIGNDSVYGGYNFLYKEEQGAKSISFKEQLYNADEIIFYGISFGYNDMHYFTDYFENIIKGKVSVKIKCYTKNEEEAKKIERRLKTFGIDLNLLYINAKFHFKYTDDFALK